ncbi:DNA phosphorothioation system sulfurtransferase DndC [Campylobacter corcagiensis]|uniref:DNA phosphorothioation system sulfurtransferase DndC n=2 Tax=Campylobacter corcagiensis TaxID=1448857 RepID=A0A7M1LHR1_9BACT|nr:DNA phosphorothioation system sulfurtransferase DndC [Campylobacter corcagiensis]
MAINIEKYLPDNNIYYLNANLLEAKEYGLEIIESKTSFLNKLIATKNNIYEKYISNKKAWIVAFSGGKDSTCVLQLLYEIMISMPKEKLNPTYAIISNTLVEAPVVDKYIKMLVKAINDDAKRRDILFEVKIVEPAQKDQFWVNLIGKGYPSPTITFRWCTERLKINPTKKVVDEIVKKHGSAILMLGVRKSESQNRKQSIEKRILSEDGFSKHDYYQNTLIYNPIVDWTLDDVWSYLTTFNPPSWKIPHNILFDLYTKASGDECQFIIDKNQSSCGGSRFGCWVCTLVNEDKSMQGFISSGKENLKPLNEFRNFIKKARENPKFRSDFNRHGEFRPGPFTSFARKLILKKLLECEKEFKDKGGINLISDEQLSLIADEWNKDFDSLNSCIKLAKEYGRMQEYEDIQDVKIINEDILDELENENKDIIKSIVKEGIYISNRGLVTKKELFDVIKKNIDNATMKIGDEDGFLQ